MVDVGAKPPMRRRAVARGRVRMAAATAERLRTLPKGDALTVARIAGIQAAKRTSDLIPLCHPLPLTVVEVDLAVDAEGVAIEAAAETTAQTGVEMEALTAVGRRRPDRLRHGEGGRQGDVDRRDRRSSRRRRSPCDAPSSGAAPMSAVAAPLPVRLARLVRLEHTVFALPFAYVGALLATDGWPGLGPMAWITVAMVGARTLAMGLNRLVDAEIDARNPRTEGRELPAGALHARPGRRAVPARSGRLPGRRLPARTRSCAGCGRSRSCMFVVYPYLKRVTWLCHLWLGASLGLAPVGAWVAITGELPWQAWALGGAVCLWVAGFDLFYALFDREHDLAVGLHSWATRFGVRGVFRGARAMHAGSVALLVARRRGSPRRRVVLARRGGRRRAARLRAPDRPTRRSPAARRRVLHRQRRPLDRVRRVRGPRHAPLSRRTSGTIPAHMRHSFGDSVASGHRGCPWGWLS